MTATGFRVEVLGSGRLRHPSAAQIRAWAGAALGRRAAGRELAVRIVGRTESRRLNRRFRGRDAPTNVLSFPATAASWPPDVRARGDARDAAAPLGDLVLCSAVVVDEARDQGKAVRAHWAHLVVHGTLHLIGYDHERLADARRMERREISVLRDLGFANPYRSAE
jgi:probable rRNA maturation factor